MFGADWRERFEFDERLTAESPIISDAMRSARLKAETISASQTSACVGCRESLACPLFVSAANDYQRAFQKSCPSTKPTVGD